MAYKAILVHVDDHPYAGARFATAASMAGAFGAHLTGLASSGIDRFSRYADAADPASPAVTSRLDLLRQRADSALAAFAKAVREAGAMDAEGRQTDADVDAALAAAAVYADLCVVGHHGKDARPDGLKRDMVADITVASGCPVLAIPGGRTVAFPFPRILLAWNGRRDASRALHAAMPLLQRANEVEVAIMGGALDNAKDFSPALEIARLLERHGVAHKVVQRRDANDAGHAVLELADDHGADLIVMGCYGHSRVREMLLGGATRSVLLGATMPVFMCA